MMIPPYVNLVVEGLLDEILLKKLIHGINCNFEVGQCYGRKGKEYIYKNINSFNIAAEYIPFIVLVDLDREDCPVNLINQWLPSGVGRKLIIRIAVHEIESWLLADRVNLARFVGISEARIPRDPDALIDPKNVLVNLARSSRKRAIIEDLVPLPNSTSLVGPNYNGQLSNFIEESWNINSARTHSDSLNRAIRAFEAFRP